MSKRAKERGEKERKDERGRAGGSWAGLFSESESARPSVGVG